MDHPIYPAFRRIGSPIAVMQEGHLYYGQYPSGMPVTTISGNCIYLNGMGGGGIDYVIEGNRIHNATSNQTVFTVNGDYVYEGSGGTEFLYCPTGNFAALAMAACFFAGDNRMRIQNSNPVAQTDIPPNARNPHDYGRTNGNIPDSYYGDNGPQSLRNQFGDRQWSRNGCDNFNNMRTPVERKTGGLFSSNNEEPQSNYESRGVFVPEDARETLEDIKNGPARFARLMACKNSEYYKSEMEKVIKIHKEKSDIIYNSMWKGRLLFRISTALCAISLIPAFMYLGFFAFLICFCLFIVSKMMNLMYSEPYCPELDEWTNNQEVAIMARTKKKYDNMEI